MGQSWIPTVVAVLATMFFAVYGFVMLVFPHRIRDRGAAPPAMKTTIALRIFGALLLFLCAVVVWAASQVEGP